jgi:hypothetical protein
MAELGGSRTADFEGLRTSREPFGHQILRWRALALRVDWRNGPYADILPAITHLAHSLSEETV